MRNNIKCLTFPLFMFAEVNLILFLHLLFFTMQATANYLYENQTLNEYGILLQNFTLYVIYEGQQP